MQNIERTILVTGCSSGIGAHCAKRLKEDGWRVFVTARKDEDIARLKSDGFEALYLDYRDAASVTACFEAVMEATGGKLYALFNNGAYSQPGAVEDLPTDALREQFEANFFGWHQLTRLVVSVMRAQGHGRIIQHSSVLGLVPLKARGAYVSSKYALEGLFTTMYMELKKSNVYVSLIETGPIPSKIAENALPYVHKYLDTKNSVHALEYERRIAELEAGGTPDESGVGQEPVYKQLKRALNAERPRVHYYVTTLTHVVSAMRRFLPARRLYGVLKRW